MDHVISATLQDVTSASTLLIDFNSTMNVTDIGLNDMSVNIISDSNVKSSWSASFVNETQLKIEMTVSGLLTGNEQVEIDFVNYKAFRGPQGG